MLDEALLRILVRFRHSSNKSALSLDRTSAPNMTLPAARAPAVIQSTDSRYVAPAAVDRYLHARAQQQTRRTPLLLSIDGTDGHPTLHRFCCGSSSSAAWRPASAEQLAAAEVDAGHRQHATALTPCTHSIIIIPFLLFFFAFSALTLLAGRPEEHPTCKN